MGTYPSWAIDLVAALEEHEDVHPTADPRFGDEHWCVKKILDAVPADVRSYVAAWKDGFQAGKAKGDHLSGGIIPVEAAARRADTVRFGDQAVKVVVDPSMPDDLVLAVGSCACGHPVGGHDKNGCVSRGAGTGEPCPCITPVSRVRLHAGRDHACSGGEGLMGELIDKSPTDPLINILRCYIALDIPNEVAVQALKQARAEQPDRRSALVIVKRAAYFIARKHYGIEAER